MNPETTTRDPEAIERDIRRTQDDMGRTVDQIGDQLTVKNVFNALLDRADENGVDARYLIDGARRNPMALGLISAGLIWLVSDKDSKFPSIPSGGKKLQAGTKDEFDLYGSDVHHRDYVTHMSSLEIREGEDDLSFQRRRDLHRANFLMCERNPDEDDHSFRQRLNDLTDKFRERRQAWSDSASQTGSAASERTRQLAGKASTRAQNIYDSNPLISGILAAAVGAALGSTIPVSRQEQEKLGSVGRKAREMANEQKDELTSKAKEKKDELVEKADDKLQHGQQQTDPMHSRQAEQAIPSTGSYEPGRDDQRTSSDRSFILPDRNA
jgi:hypothetical protein